MKSRFGDLIAHHTAVDFGMLLFHYVQSFFTVSTTDYGKPVRQKLKWPERTAHMNHDQHNRSLRDAITNSRYEQRKKNLSQTFNKVVNKIIS